MQSKLVDDRYRVVSRIGQGAMGKVFKAEHVYTKRPVALKVIHDQFQQDEKYRIRFLREIELACRVQHPNAVTIFDAGQLPSGKLYMSMEYLDGQTLTNVLKQYPKGLALDVALHIAYQIGQALEAIHEAGLVHRDLKPDNIMVLMGPNESLRTCTVKILDFGIARNVDTLHSITGKMMIGTPKFMSPEQTRGEKLTLHSDIYNLGLILYAMLTGKEPFSSDSPVGYVFHHNMTQPAPVSSLRSDVPAHIEWAIQKALSKEPSMRFDTVKRFLATLTVGRSGFRKSKKFYRSALKGLPVDIPVGKSNVWVRAMAIAAVVIILVFGGLSMLAGSSGALVAEEEQQPYELMPHYGQIASDTIQIIYRDTLSRKKKDPEVKQEAPFQDRVVPAGPPVVPEWNLPARAAEQPKILAEHSTKEEDPNVSNYNHPLAKPRIRPANLATEPKSIEENSNIVRLREQQRVDRENKLNKAFGYSDGYKTSSKNLKTSLPSIKGGIDKLQAQIRYPEAAASARVMGVVGVRLSIDVDGRVLKEEITESLGYGCDEEVLRVLKNAQFEPARIGNKPIKAWLNLQFSFQLKP